MYEICLDIEDERLVRATRSVLAALKISKIQVHENNLLNMFEEMTNSMYIITFIKTLPLAVKYNQAWSLIVHRYLAVVTLEAENV